MTYPLIQRWLCERMWLDAALLSGPGFEALVRERLLALGCEDERGYLGALERLPEEGEHLAAAIAVPETWFFRYPSSFSLLLEHLAARLHAGQSRLRMLSIGCAGGEEPYGMAMAALAAGWAAENVVVDAFDRSTVALERARSAEYGSFSLRHEVPAWAIEYLRHDHERIVVRERARDLVRFHCADVLERGLFLRGGPADVVFCRNVMIYLNEGARTRLVDAIEEALAENGLLFVGHAEPLLAVRQGLARVDRAHAFALVRTPAALSVAAPVPAVGRPRAAGAASTWASMGVSNGAGPLSPIHSPATSSLSAVDAARVVVRASDASGARDRVAIETEQSAGVEKAETGALEEARLLADAGRMREGEDLLRALLKRGGPSASALELLGTLRLAAGDLQEAKACFDRALYLEPGRPTSLVQLALIHERAGDHAAAERAWARAQRANDGVAR